MLLSKHLWKIKFNKMTFWLSLNSNNNNNKLNKIIIWKAQLYLETHKIFKTYKID